MARPAPPVVPLADLKVGVYADTFARLAEKARHETRDGKPFYKCRFADRRRSVEAVVWGDAALFDECDGEWTVNAIYRLRGGLGEHPKYGLQFEIHAIRPANADDAKDGFKEADFYDRSRFEPAETLARLRQLAETELQDAPLKALTLLLLDTHAGALQKLPASFGRFYPFPGGWVEHVWNVTRHCVHLVDSYREHYPELSPPLNRDLVIAGAVLHDIGRVTELTAPDFGVPAEPTVVGRLMGHVALGRDLIRDAAKTVEGLNPELLLLLEHVVLSHLTLPEWGSPRLPMIPEVLILHHADDLDAKMEMYARHLTRDASEGPFTAADAVLKKPLLKARTV